MTPVTDDGLDSSVHALLVAARLGRIDEWHGPELVREAVAGVFASATVRQYLDYPQAFRFAVEAVVSWNLVELRVAELAVGPVDWSFGEGLVCVGEQLTNDVRSLIHAVFKDRSAERPPVVRSLAAYIYGVRREKATIEPGREDSDALSRVLAAGRSPMPPTQALDRNSPTLAHDLIALIVTCARTGHTGQAFSMNLLGESGLYGPRWSGLVWEFGLPDLWLGGLEATSLFGRLLAATIPLLEARDDGYSAKTDTFAFAESALPRIELSDGDEDQLQEFVQARWCKYKVPSAALTVFGHLVLEALVVPLLLIQRSSRRATTRELAERLLTSYFADLVIREKKNDAYRLIHEGYNEKRYRRAILARVPLVVLAAAAVTWGLSAWVDPSLYGFGVLAAATLAVYRARVTSRYKGPAGWGFSATVAVLVQLPALLPLLLTGVVSFYLPLALVEPALVTVAFAGVVRWHGFAIRHGISNYVPGLIDLPEWLKEAVDKSVEKTIEEDPAAEVAVPRTRRSTRARAADTP